MRNSKMRMMLFALSSIFVLLLPMARIVLAKLHSLYLLDFAAYCAVSRALFSGRNPFPDNMEVLMFSFGRDVPIVFPGQMLVFALPGFAWSDALQIGYIALNVLIVLFITALTLVRACGYAWKDILVPGPRQLLFAVCASLFMSSWSVMQTMRLGQIPVILALCLYGIFWLPRLSFLRPFAFALVAVAKYSVLTVFAPLLFFKGHVRLCLVAFVVFVGLALSPALCGNNLAEVYCGYSKAVVKLFEPGGVNHYGMTGITSCHLGFFRIGWLNHVMKCIAVCPVVWLLWRERKSPCISDTALMLAFSLTMLISYHSLHDYTLVFPLFIIRLFAFAKERNWRFFGVMALFPAYLITPGSIIERAASLIGRIPGVGSVIQLSNPAWNPNCRDLFPLTAMFAIALAVWSLYLYRRVGNPYLFGLAQNSERMGV